MKLLVHHCNIDAENSDGDTPLHVAYKQNHDDILKYLKVNEQRAKRCLSVLALFRLRHAYVAWERG